MAVVRIALANLPLPSSPDESVALAVEAVAQAGREGAAIVCFPETYIPGYRGMGRYLPPPPDAAFLSSALDTVCQGAQRARVAVVLGTERVAEGAALPLITAAVISSSGTLAGFQDKVQIDPSEEANYAPGAGGRTLFECGPLRFGIAICHEGWRYPETVRWAARRGAHVVFHPHLHLAEPDAFRPAGTFADPANTFHEKALLCRAAENTCFVASVNCASEGSPTTSAVVRPDGAVLAWQPYGEAGLLVVDIDTAAATGLLASRFKEQP